LAAKQGNLADLYAINILQLTDSLQYEEPIILPGEGDLLLRMEGNNNQNNSVLPNGKTNILNANNEFAATLFNVYPNPVGNVLFVEYSLADNAGNIVVDITDISGKKVKQISITNNKGKINISTSNWKPGIYYVSLSINGTITKSIKITVIHQ
jgi:hypothetical protein